MEYNKTNHGFGKDLKAPKVLPRSLPIDSWLSSQWQSIVSRWLR
jgi:hypothetical protein